MLADSYVDGGASLAWGAPAPVEVNRVTPLPTMRSSSPVDPLTGRPYAFLGTSSDDGGAAVWTRQGTQGGNADGSYLDLFD